MAAIKCFPPDGPILDVGGGNGFVTQRMIKDGFKAVLLEPGPAGALAAKKVRDIPEVICATIEDAGIEENAFCGVGLFDVLEHIEDQKRFVGQIKRVLRPGGILYLTVPAYQCLWSLNDVTAQHYRRYNKHALTQILQGQFEILYSTYFFQALILPLFFFRSLPHRLVWTKNLKLINSSVEHGASGGLLSKAINKLLKAEPIKIRQGKKIILGTSCLIVATCLR